MSIQRIFSALALPLVCLVTLVSGVAHAYNYTVCINWQAQTNDSCNSSTCGIPGGPDSGIYEDAYTGCNAGCTGPARGVRVKMSRSGWSNTYDASPSTGCFSFSDTGTSYTMTVYGYQTNANGTFARIHDSYNDWSSSYPGSTYSIVVAGTTPTHGGSNTYNVGSFDRKWTTMLVLGYGIYVWANDLTSKEIHAGLDMSRCIAASAHYGSCGTSCAEASCNSNANITNGRHYLWFGAQAAPACPNSIASNKFIVGHELGHAIAALWYGGRTGAANGGEPCYDGSHAVTPNACGTENPLYSMRTKEWNNVGFREGYAHFIAARIWNDKAETGAFKWFEADMYSLRQYDFGSGLGGGGRLENECCTSGCSTSWANAGTSEDWMRFLWGWYNNNLPGCQYQPSGRDMLEVYAETRLNGGLSGTNYYTKMRAAAGGVGLQTCLATTAFDEHADQDGVDN